MPAIELPRLRADQYRIAVHPAKRKEAAMGRRWGKSTLGGVLIMNVLRQHGKCAWVVPTFKNGRSLWRWTQRVAYPMVAEKIWDVSKTERTITTHRGGFFGMYSDDNIDAIRSEDFDLVINDEASRIKAESIEEAIVPCLADRDGSLINISTPRGRNWWYDQCQLAKLDMRDHVFFTAPSSDNPNPNIQKAAALAETRVARSVYEQEWLALFVEDGLTLFTIADIDHASTSYVVPTAGQWLTTVDVGRRRDATVINTFDIRQKPYRRVDFERLERLPYPLIQQHIEAQARRWPGKLIIESNGIGDPLIENLEVKAEPFITTAKSKLQALQALQLLFEQHDIQAIWDARERAALVGCSWDEDHTPDEVMSLAIFAHAVSQPRPAPFRAAAGPARFPAPAQIGVKAR
jgi:hypothetical protein